jgi:hypothetical protein
MRDEGNNIDAYQQGPNPPSEKPVGMMLFPSQRIDRLDDACSAAHNAAL